MLIAFLLLARSLVPRPRKRRKVGQGLGTRLDYTCIAQVLFNPAINKVEDVLYMVAGSRKGPATTTC